MNFWTERVLERIKTLFSASKDCGPVDSCEILVRSRKTYTVSSFLKQELSAEQKKHEWAQIRIHGQGKISSFSQNSFEEADLENLVQSAVWEFKKAKNEQKHPISNFAYTGPSQSFLDDTFLLIPNEEKASRLANLAKHLKTVNLEDDFQVQGIYREDHWMESLWVSGSEKPLSWEKCVGQLQAEALLERNGQVFKGSCEISDAVYYGMDWPQVIKEAALQAQSFAGQVAPVAGQYTVLLSPRVASRLAWYVGQALRGDLVNSGQSFFADKKYTLGKTLLSNNELHLVDDPHYKKSVGMALWDTEGFPTQRHEMISAGVLKTFPQNHSSALYSHLPRTGSAVRSWNQVDPIVGYHNLVLEPGKRDFVDLLRSVQNGLYIVGLDSIENVNLLTGQFRMGCVGLRLENGLEGEAVGRFFIEGNLSEFLSSISAVGRDIRWFGRVASGSLLCEHMQVSPLA